MIKKVLNRGPKKPCHFYFFWIASWHIGRF